MFTWNLQPTSPERREIQVKRNKWLISRLINIDLIEIINEIINH
jgi:hypothetical protein